MPEHVHTTTATQPPFSMGVHLINKPAEPKGTHKARKRGSGNSCVGVEGQVPDAREGTPEAASDLLLPSSLPPPPPNQWQMGPQCVAGESSQGYSLFTPHLKSWTTLFSNHSPLPHFVRSPRESRGDDTCREPDNGMEKPEFLFSLLPNLRSDAEKDFEFLHLPVLSPVTPDPMLIPQDQNNTTTEADLLGMTFGDLSWEMSNTQFSKLNQQEDTIQNQVDIDMQTSGSQLLGEDYGTCR